MHFVRCWTSEGRMAEVSEVIPQLISDIYETFETFTHVDHGEMLKHGRKPRA